MVSMKICRLIFLFLLIHTLRANQKLDLNRDVDASDVEELDRSSFSFPGTKWCGPGNTAHSFDDLGEYRETDKCCRAHDNCDNIPSGEMNHGLINNNSFTVLHCDCDKAFHKCLQASEDEAGEVIGEKYFLLQSRCYREDYPIKGCKEYDKRLIFRRCIKYDLDTSKPKKYQFFNLPFYGDGAFQRGVKISFVDTNTIDSNELNDD